MLLAHPAAARADVLDSASQLAGRLGGLFSSAFQSNQTQNPAAAITVPWPEEKAALTVRPPTPAPVTSASLSHIAPAQVAPPAPSIEKRAQHFFCVEYARMRSGLAVFGDARLWWERARTLYTRLSHPVEEAVMVFSGSRRLKRGHVAVVTRIVSPREIIVDQANWQNRGEIDHDTPVLDVSKNNDWSKVRVWNVRTNQFGTHVYPVSGFIAKGLAQQARNG